MYKMVSLPYDKAQENHSDSKRQKVLQFLMSQFFHPYLGLRSLNNIHLILKYSYWQPLSFHQSMDVWHAPVTKHDLWSE